MAGLGTLRSSCVYLYRNPDECVPDVTWVNIAQYYLMSRNWRGRRGSLVLRTPLLAANSGSLRYGNCSTRFSVVGIAAYQSCLDSQAAVHYGGYVMFVVFCIGLVIGTLAGMFSWLAVAAFLESRRGLEEGLFIRNAVQPELTTVTTDSAVSAPEERTHRLFRPHVRRVAPVVPTITLSETRRPPRSL